jgi:hypothetical protein
MSLTINENAMCAYHDGGRAIHVDAERFRKHGATIMGGRAART